MRLDTEIVTSQGVCKLTIIRKDDTIVEADLWRSTTFLESGITVFSAGVYLKWNGTRYVIIRRKATDYKNAYWLELENLISNVIMVNE